MAQAYNGRVTFGEWMQEQREKAGLTPTQAARRGGLTVQAWSDLEHDRSRRADGSPSRPSFRTLTKVAVGLGVDVEAVLARGGVSATDRAAVARHRLEPELAKALRRMGERIREVREAQGLSQQEVARRLGVERSVMSQYEAGTIDLPTSKLLKLARILDTYVGDLVGHTEGDVWLTQLVQRLRDPKTREMVRWVMQRELRRAEAGNGVGSDEGATFETTPQTQENTTQNTG